MPDAGRDFKISFLSDTSKLELDTVSRGLDEVADSAEHTDRALARIDTDTTRRDLDKLGDEAKTTATRWDTAMDKIARSSKDAARKVDTGGTEKMKDSLHEVKDEASDTAREMFASFSDTGDLRDAAQELSANAGALFGPVGLAIGGALSAGIAIFQQNAEQLKQTTSDLTDALIEGAGKVKEESVFAKLNELLSAGTLDQYKQAVSDARVSAADFNLALAGDPGAIARVSAEIDANREALRAHADASGIASQGEIDMTGALDKLSGAIGPVSGAMDQARARYDEYKAATDRAKTATATTATTMATQGAKAAQSYAGKLRDGIPDVEAAARDMSQSAADAAAAKPVVIPITADPANFYLVLNSARKQAALARTMP